MANEDFERSMREVAKVVQQLSRVMGSFAQTQNNMPDPEAVASPEPASEFPAASGEPPESHVAEISDGIGRIADGLAEIARAISAFTGPAERTVEGAVARLEAEVGEAGAEVLHGPGDAPEEMDELGFPAWVGDDPRSRATYRSHLRDKARHEAIGKEPPEIPEGALEPERGDGEWGIPEGAGEVEPVEAEDPVLPDSPPMVPPDGSRSEEPHFPVGEPAAEDPMRAWGEAPEAEPEPEDVAVHDRMPLDELPRFAVDQPLPLDAARSPSAEDPHGVGEFERDVNSQEAYGQILHEDNLHHQRQKHQSDVHLWEEQVAFNERAAKDMANMHRRQEWVSASFERSLNTMTDTNV